MITEYRSVPALAAEFGRAPPLEPRRTGRIDHVPEIDYAFLADAAQTVPGQKFHILGGGITRIAGRTFPLRHPHIALVVGLLVTAPETDRPHDIRFVLLDADGREVAGAAGSLTAHGQTGGRDATLTFAIDLWNLTFPSPGDYSFRVLVNGSERKRVPLEIAALPSEGDAGGPGGPGGPTGGTSGGGPSGGPTNGPERRFDA